MPTPTSATHHVLFCQDILLEILIYISPGWFPWNHSDYDVGALESQQGLRDRRVLQRTLASCALTCRALSDLALAELWRVLDHHVFLLKVLPWRTCDDSLFDEMLDLEPEIGDRAWSRFRWYARHVREMKGYVHPHPRRIGVHRNTWNLLASRLQGEPLLPSLRRLQMPVDVDDIVPFLFSLSPTLRAFTMEFRSGFAIVPQHMAFISPFLTLISDPSGYSLDDSVCRQFSHEGDVEQLVQHFRKCTRLEKLEELDLTVIRYSITHSAVASLSRLRSLHTLRAALRVQNPPISHLFTGFARLRHLELRLLSLPVLSGILTTGGLRTLPLQSIELESIANTADNTDVPLPILECQHHLSLIRAALPDELESFRLWLTYSARAEPPLPLSTLFGPFLTLGRLKSFKVSFSLGYIPHVADDDLHALAAAWPHLDTLYVWAWEMRVPTFSTARPPTMAGLAELARGCLQLRRVTLPALDVSALPELSTLPREGHQGVRFLDMSALVHDDGVAVEDVAKILDQLFPQHEEYSRIWAGNSLAESWFAVQEAMRGRRAARIGSR